MHFSDHTETSSRRRNLYILLACVLIPAVLCISFLPGTEKYALHTNGHLHSLGHLVAFCVLGYLAMRIARSVLARSVLFLLVLSMGLAIEIGEHLFYRSYMEWKDVLLDFVGVLAGTILALATEPELKHAPDPAAPAHSPLGH